VRVFVVFLRISFLPERLWQMARNSLIALPLRFRLALALLKFVGYGFRMDFFAHGILISISRRTLISVTSSKNANRKQPRSTPFACSARPINSRLWRSV